MLARWFHGLRRYLHAHGWRRTAAEVAQRTIGREEQLIVLVKDLGAIVQPRAHGEIGLEDLGAAHLPQLAQLNRKRGRPDADRRFARDLEHGFHGFVGYRDGELARLLLVGRPRCPQLAPGSAQAGAGNRTGGGRGLRVRLLPAGRAPWGWAGRGVPVQRRAQAARARLLSVVGICGQRQPPCTLGLQYARLRADVAS